MRFNDRELIQISERKPTIEGLLQYLKPQSNDWSDWYQASIFKERFFKLVNNLLFYYRLNALNEPLGIIVLENMQIAYETPGPAFAFSLSSIDGKHIFACRCQDDVNKWVNALQSASFQYLRSMQTLLETKISMKLGEDPILINVRRKEEAAKNSIVAVKVNKSTFYDKRGAVATTSSTREDLVVDNLIDLS